MELSEKNKLTSKLYSSNRIYKKKIDDNAWVFFAPDMAGMPIVLNTLAYKTYMYFNNGALIDDIVRLLMAYEKYDSKEILEVIQILLERGFLRFSPTPEKYLAEEVQDIDKIQSIDIWLHITNNCNLKCDYCFVKQKTHAEMRKEVIDKVIEQINFTAVTHPSIKRITIKFAGGEPTLVMNKMEYFYETLAKKIENLDVKLMASVLTNGTLIDTKVINFLKTHNIGVGISLDGYGPDGHDYYRKFKKNNAGSWETINKNVTDLIAQGIAPYIMATISRESCKTLKNLVTWIFNRHMRARLSVVRQPGFDWINDAQHATEYKKYTDILIASFEEAFSELEKECYSISGENNLQICELRFNTPSCRTCCGIGVNHIIINERGQLACCPMWVHENNFMPTDNDLLRSIRRTFDFCPSAGRKNQEGEVCLSCRWFPVCVGGCSIANTMILGKPFAVSSLHDFYMYVIPRYIEFYGKKMLQRARKNGIDDFQILLP